MYCSAVEPKIFQDEPLEWRPSSFPLKGWTDTEAGYLYEADKLSRCIWENRKLMGRGYTWEVSINIEKEMPFSEIGKQWSAVCLSLKRRGIVALWVREPSRQNHCNYHLIIKNEISRRDLEDAIEGAVPPRSELPYHKHIGRIASQWHYIRYMTKAKTGGYVNGRFVSDKYRKKRLLFIQGPRLWKSFHIGDFWEKPRDDIWDEIKDREKKIAEGLERPLIRQLCEHVYEMCGGAVSRKRIERSFGYSADTSTIREWAETVDQGDHQWSVDNEQLDRNGTSETGLQRAIPRSFVSKVCSRVWPLVTMVWGTAQACCATLWRSRPDPLSLHPP